MISIETCRRVLHKAVSTGADYAELFAENTSNHTINMIASKVDSIQDTTVAGAAVRVYKGLRSVMASTVDTSEQGLLACAEKAAERSEERAMAILCLPSRVNRSASQWKVLRHRSLLTYCGSTSTKIIRSLCLCGPST